MNDPSSYNDDPNMRFDGGRWLYWDGSDWCSWVPGRQSWVSVTAQAEQREKTRRSVGFIIVGISILGALAFLGAMVAAVKK